MGMSGDTALTLAKNYVKKTLQGQGALKGQDGFSPIVTENKDNTDEIYKLDITTKDGTFTTPNLKGFIGADGFSPIATVTKVGNTTTITLTDKNGTTSEMIMDGETNIIESITVNGVAVPISDKTVNIDLSGYVEKEDGKTLVSASDVSQIRKNKDDIATLNGTGDGSVDKKIADKLSEQTYLTKKIITADEASAYIADPHTAKFNVIYLVKDESVSGSDKYFEYQRIGNEESSTFEMTGDTSTNLADYAKSAEIPTTVAELTDSADYAKKTDIPTSLPADGGNADTVNNHTVETDVPVDAVFTDTIYDDTEVKGSIEEVNSNLSQLELSDIAGGKNLWSIGDIKVSGDVTTEVLISGIFKSNTQYTIKLKTKSFTTSDIGHFEFIYTDGTKTIISWDKSIGGAYATTSDYGKTIDILQWTGWNHGEYAEFTEIQLEEGDTATPYKPYIPSVKMLAEEVSAQNKSLSDLENAINGLNDDNYWEQGTWNILGQKVDEPTIIRMKEKLILPIDYSVSLVNSNYVYEVDYYENGAYKNDTDWISGSIVIPNGQEFVLLIRKVDNSSLVPTERNAISVLPKNIGTINDKLKNDLVPKKIELQNVDEKVTIQDNGSFIINGFAFVNLLVTFNETLPQWSNFVRLPRPKGGNVSVHCENSVILAIYSQDNLPGDCGTTENVASGTEIRLLVNYEVA